MVIVIGSLNVLIMFLIILFVVLSGSVFGWVSSVCLVLLSLMMWVRWDRCCLGVSEWKFGKVELIGMMG